MKSKTLITFIIIGLAITTANAQKDKHFEIGLQGGFGSTWVINQNNYGLEEMDYDYKFGPMFNLQLGYNFNESIGLFTEIGTSAQGQKYFDTWGNNDIEREVKLNYLNVPLLFKYSYGESRARFRLLAGPQFCFLQKAEQEYTKNGVNAEGEFELEDLDGNKFDPAAKDIKDRLNSMDIAIVVDLGADIFVVPGMLYASVGVRFWYGLTDLNVDAYHLENMDGNYDPSHNAAVMGLVGFHYIIGGEKIVQ